MEIVNKRLRSLLISSPIGLSIVLIIGILAGSYQIDFSNLFDSDSVHLRVIYELRLPRFILSFIAGIVLSLSGFIYQGVLRNPLASPYTLGIAGGASLGAFIAAIFVPDSHFFISLGAMVGALLPTFAIGLYSSRKEFFSLEKIVLIGISFNLLFSSLIIFSNLVLHPYERMGLDRWLMGQITIFHYSVLIGLFALVLFFLFYVFNKRKVIDLLSFGDFVGRNLGYDIDKERKRLLLITSLIVSVVVAFVGPIGFVGIVIPHVIRILFSGSLSQVFPVIIILGGSYLSLMDSLTRLIPSDSTIPIGVICSLIGIPFFLFTLMKRK